jgi:peptide-methionine (S)-S-oxide reductase
MGGEVAIKGNGGNSYSLENALPARYHEVAVFLNGKQLAKNSDYTIKRLNLEMTKPVSAEDEFYVVIVNPTYEQVCTKTSGHAEVIQVAYDPTKVSFDVLLQVFWKTHDPTTLNRQGNDVGPQYRSAVFYHSDTQKDLADNYKKKLNEVKAYPNPVVTEITKASTFYAAEDYHQDYFNKNPTNRYCQMLIPAKLEKLKKVFGDKLKKN